MFVIIDKYSNILIYLILIICIKYVGTQTCTNENPCPTPATKGIDESHWSNVVVSSSSAGNYITPEGTNGVLYAVFNTTFLVDKQVLTVLGTQYKIPVLDSFWVSGNSFISTNNYKEEYIEYDFKDKFLVRAVNLVFRSPSTTPQDMRPKAMKLQGKNAEGNWVDWFYYAEDCVASYNKLPADMLFNATQCNLRSVVEPPTSNGGALEVGFRPVEYFRDELYKNPQIYEFFTTSSIRVVFNKPPILDQATISYYTVANLDINFQCACFGHGTTCAGENGGKCDCLHNTGGNNCQQCLPLFNNAPWAMSLDTRASTCQECNCNNRSTTCEYDPIERSGRCTGCQYNTTGRNCESCSNNFYLNPQAGVATGTCAGSSSIGITTYNCGDVCIPCNCTQAGTQFLGVPCEPTTGQCSCKTNVGGRACDVCKDGYYELDFADSNGCKQCDCDVRGMVTCNKLTGACQCKSNTIEPNCIGCKIGYYNFTAENPDGCTYCDCAEGLSNHQSCDPVVGNCNCRTGTTGRDCRMFSPVYFAPRLDYFTFEAEYAVNISKANLVERPGGGISTFTGRGFFKVMQPPPPLTQPTIIFSITVPASLRYQIIIRYESDVAFPKVVSTLTTSTDLSLLGLSNDPCINATLPQISSASLTAQPSAGFTAMTPDICLVRNVNYLLTLTFEGNLDVTKNILIDSLVLLPVLDSVDVYLASSGPIKSTMVDCLTGAQNASWTSGQCNDVTASIMVDINKSAYPCACDPVGSVDNNCQSLGGQCTCKPNVFLRNCSQCQLYSYGFNSQSGCTKCDCNANGSTSLYCSDSGACECKVNVTGSKCDRCIDKHYGLQTGLGCKPCNCGGIYVLNDTCMDSGQCFCKPGVGGMGCDSCAVGYYGLTDEGCTSCGCDVDGSVDVSCHHMAGGCQCKNNVEGPQCNKCKTGFYGLGPYSKDGCLACYCSGHSTDCTSAPKWFKALSSSHWDVLEGDVFGARWTGLDGNGKATDLEKQVYLNNERQVLRMVNQLSDTNPAFFVSPPTCTQSVVTSPTINASTSCFVSFKAPSYGQYLRFTLAANTSAVFPPPPPPNPPPLPQPPVVPVLNFPYPEGDVIIIGSKTDVKLVTNLTSNPLDSPTDYKIQIREDSWFKNSVSSGVRPTFGEMMDVLYDVKAIYIRSKFSNVVGSVAYLFKVEMDYAIDKLTGVDYPATNVEQCVCPHPYEGQFCEKCKAGYTKSKTKPGDCVPCDCNKHEYPGTTCDPETGVCRCTHHTTGDQCQDCEPTYYGVASLGQPDSCKACMCPGDITNRSPLLPVHSTTCNNTGAQTFECQCDVGYIGARCDQGAPGYYGQPSNSSVNGGVCTKCDCNNYNDDQCDPVTGVCLACGGNTVGFGCRQCLPNHYAFDFILTKRCQPCDCTGAASTGCNNQTGACNCKPGAALTTGCSQCLEGFYGFSADGCKACGCYIPGTLNNNPNCSNTGVCSCSGNFVGDKCDSCKDNNYGSNCQTSCGCLTAYTVNGDATCDINTGQCRCLQGFTGTKCDACSPYAGSSYTGIKEVLDSNSIFPNCVSCGKCFEELANKSSMVNEDIIEHNTQLVQLRNQYYPSIEPTVLRQSLDSIKDSYLATNHSLMEMQDLIAYRDNISLFDVDTRITDYETNLTSIDATKTALETAMVPLREINSETLRTGNSLLPVVSLTNVNNKLQGDIQTQNNIVSSADQAFNDMYRHDALVKNLPTAIGQLTSRVTAANATLAGTTTSLNTWAGQMDGINPSKFNNEIIRTDFYQKTVRNEVEVLAEDMTTARYYTSVSAVMYKNGSDQLVRYSTVYSTLNSQFSLNSNISRLAQTSKTMADEAKITVDNFCNTANRQYQSVELLISNLSKVKEELESPLLSQYNSIMQQISSINIDPQSNQISTLANQISAENVPGERVASIGQLADSSSVTAQSLSSTLNSAVNSTQSAKKKVEDLQANLQKTSKDQSDLRNCLATSSNQYEYINTTIFFIQGKANETMKVGQLTADALLNHTNTAEPIKNAFQNTSTNITNSINSLTLTNNSIESLQRDLESTTNSIPAATLTLSNKRTEYQRWKVTKDQLELCVNDLWTSFNAINQPVSVTDLLDHSNSQATEIEGLLKDIDDLQRELEALQQTLKTASQNGIECKNLVK